MGSEGWESKTAGALGPRPSLRPNRIEDYGRLTLVLSPLLLMVNTPDAVEV
jgi:hypothetical protein